QLPSRLLRAGRYEPLCPVCSHSEAAPPLLFARLHPGSLDALYKPSHLWPRSHPSVTAPAIRRFGTISARRSESFRRIRFGTAPAPRSIAQELFVARTVAQFPSMKAAPKPCPFQLHLPKVLPRVCRCLEPSPQQRVSTF